MAFAQLTFRESLRDIEVCLRSMKNKLYHMGIRSQISRNTLSNANEKRDWRIYADFAQALMHMARNLYVNEQFSVDLNQAAYALDATTIDLCLSLFPWSKWTKHQGAVKLHALLNLKGNIPSFAKVTRPSVCDHDILDDIEVEPGAFYIMDRGYIDLSRLYTLDQFGAFFVIRQRAMLNWKRRYSSPVDKEKGLLCDQTIYFTGRYSKPDYPEQLRRVGFYDSKSKKEYYFFTNNFYLPASTIAQLYKCRWQVELFFRWIKQHLRIKAFYGTSENAVKTQIWIAISVYLLVAIIRKKLNIEHNLYTILQILSITAFEKVDILQVLTKIECINQSDECCNQLELFNL